MMVYRFRCEHEGCCYEGVTTYRADLEAALDAHAHHTLTVTSGAAEQEGR